MPEHPDHPVLLLGASGILGRQLASLLGPARTIATHLGRGSPGSVFFDCRSTGVATLWERLPARPATAIVMLGITSIDACARDPAGTAKTNVDAVIRVIDSLLAHGVMPMFVSSDGVFDGSRAWWGEQDEVHPMLEYGRQKLQVERHLAATGAGLVVRLPKLLEDGSATAGLLPGWIEALGKDEPILCATDQFFTPASARDAAAAILLLADRRASGLVHVAGPQRLSRRELLSHVIDEYSRFAAPRARVTDCLLRELPLDEPRPLDTSMRTERLTGEFGHTLKRAQDAARQAVRDHFQSTTTTP